MDSASGAPEIAAIYPDFVTSVRVPAIITGESFVPGRTEVKCWEPPSANGGFAATGPAYPAKGSGNELPEVPPAESKSADIVDVEGRVIVARLKGSVIWVGVSGKWSRPCLVNVAKPFWLSCERAGPGELVYAVGRGLRPEGRGVNNAYWSGMPEVDCTIILCSGEHVYPVELVPEGRSTQWVRDSRLVSFHVPDAIPAGLYSVYLHNGLGGIFGWVRAGHLVVEREEKPATAMLNVRDFGAAGDGIANDHDAIVAAMNALPSGGGIVFLPPGTYRIDRTLCLLPGVRLHGAGRENTVLRGCGYPGHGLPAAVLRMTDGTEINELTVCGAVKEGVAIERCQRSDMSNDGMIRIEADQPDQEVVDVRIISCRIRSLEEDPVSREPLYLKAIHVGRDCFGRCARLSINNNEIYGSLFFGVAGGWRYCATNGMTPPQRFSSPSTGGPPIHCWIPINSWTRPVGFASFLSGIV